MSPVATKDEPLWQTLRAALTERGYSVRAFAKACAQASPTASWDSWKRTINRALDDDAERPYTPSRETAELWAKLLKKPKTYFVRQQPRVSLREENEQLKDELARLRRELERRARTSNG